MGLAWGTVKAGVSWWGEGHQQQLRPLCGVSDHRHGGLCSPGAEAAPPRDTIPGHACHELARSQRVTTKRDCRWAQQQGGCLGLRGQDGAESRVCPLSAATPPAAWESVAVALRAEGGGPFKAGGPGGISCPRTAAGPRHTVGPRRGRGPRYPPASPHPSPHPRPASPNPPASPSPPAPRPLCPLSALGGAPWSPSVGCGGHSPSLRSGWPRAELPRRGCGGAAGAQRARGGLCFLSVLLFLALILISTFIINF